MRAKDFLSELVPLAPVAAAAAPALGAAARSAIPKAVQFGKELYKKAMTPAAKPTTAPAVTPGTTTSPSSIIQVPQKVGGGARDTATQARMQTARTGEPPASTIPQVFKSNRTGEPFVRRSERRSGDSRKELDPLDKYYADQAKRSANLDDKIMGATLGTAGVGIGVPLFTMGGDKGAKDDQKQGGSSTPVAGSTATPAAPAAPAAGPSAGSTARPARGPQQGVVGSELSNLSGGEFASRADRLNQEKVDKVLGAGKFKAGTAAANTALRDYYKQNRPSDTAADDALRTQLRKDQLDRQRKEREGASSSTVAAPATAAPATAAPAAQPATVAPSVALTPGQTSSDQTRKRPEDQPAGADSGGDSAGWDTPKKGETQPERRPIDTGVDTSWIEEELNRIIKLSKNN